MNRNNFVLSWGRKMFFGLGWPLLCFIALSYFQGQTIPSTPLELFYFLVTLIGHYGLITAILYFIVYAPMARLFPHYYFARLWFTLIIMTTGLLIFIDSLVFSLYHIHINRFILTLIVEGGIRDILDPHPSLYIIVSTLFITLMFYLWYRGERTWRWMQRRFSNPNKNWYLVLIAALVLLSHLLHIYGDAFNDRKITRHAKIFPLYFPATAKGFLDDANLISKRKDIQEGGTRDFIYPVEPVNCPLGINKNILFITVNDWTERQINQDETPLLIHYLDHSIQFTNHHSGGTDFKGSIFSIFYGLPELYLRPAFRDQVSPVFFDELQHQGYEIGTFSEFPLKEIQLEYTVFSNISKPKVSENINEQWREWLESYLSNDKGGPFFGLLALENPEGVDAKISDVIEGLHAKGLIDETIIFITGSNGRKLPLDTKVPLIVIWPDKSPMLVNEMTSHYDFVPTIMSEKWKCKEPVSHYSDGKSLFTEQSKDWFLIGDHNEYQIIDYLNNQIIKIAPSNGYTVTDFNLRQLKGAARKSLILKVFKDQTRFRKKVKF